MNDKVALVTGAGIGIGRATAKALSEAGYAIAVTDVLEKEGAEAARSITDAGGVAQFFPMDVTSTEGVDKVVTDVEESLGSIEVLVCNAGIAKRIPLSSMKDSEWDLTLDVNLKGMMRVIRAAAPAMTKRGSGAVVCISSIVGTAYGWPEHVPYTASKAAVAGLVRGVAMELAGSGVRVNGIAPGFVRTAQTLDPYHSVGEDGLEAVAPRIPLGRVGDPTDIADVAVFLTSHDARYITGQILTVDGGLLVGL